MILYVSAEIFKQTRNRYIFFLRKVDKILGSS